MFDLPLSSVHETEKILHGLRKRMLSKRQPISLEEWLGEVWGVHASAGAAVGNWIGGEKGKQLEAHFTMLGKLGALEHHALANKKFREGQVESLREIIAHVSSKLAQKAQAPGAAKLTLLSRSLADDLEGFENRGHRFAQAYLQSAGSAVYDHLILGSLPKLQQLLVEDFHRRLVDGVAEVFEQAQEERGLAP